MSDFNVDATCERAIAESAVEARQWLAANEDNLAAGYQQNVAEALYDAGAAEVWFNDFEETEDEEVVLVGQIIVRLPEESSDQERTLAKCRDHLRVQTDEPTTWIGTRFVLIPQSDL